MAGKFTRFSEKRDAAGSDVTSYDDAVEGVEPDQTSGLDVPLAEDNVGFKLIQKMGWKAGAGLGRRQQGRTEPIPLAVKDDYMGLGRFQMELDLAAEATEKRRQLEIEKELTPGLILKYQERVEKESAIADSTAELRRSYHCDLCDKQYSKYSEYDNHLNSYDHHHRQRLRDLKQYETGRRFGGHRSAEELQEKMLAAHAVAIERAQMTYKRMFQGTNKPGFKPIGEAGKMATFQGLSNSRDSLAGKKRTSSKLSDSEKKIADKKARLAKYGVQFQSAGHLASIQTSSAPPLSSYQAVILANAPRPEDRLVPTGMEPSDDAAGNYRRHFVLAGSSAGEKMPVDAKELETKVKETLPNAAGRLKRCSEAAAAASHDSDDEEDFTTSRHHPLVQSSRGRAQGAGKLTKFSVKLTKHYDSYYY